MRKLVALGLAFIVILLGGYLLFNEEEESVEELVREEEESVSKPQVADILNRFMGRPYDREGPLGEGEEEQIYREDVFDCTTLVLTVAAIRHGEDNPEEKMKEIHYHPPGEVSYENRLHFSTYRNKISDYFEDITREVAGDLTETETVVLNKNNPADGRLIDIDWEKEMEIEWVPTERVSEITSDLPAEAGVGFVRTEWFEEGLDIVHEGFVLEGDKLVHASLEEMEVTENDFLTYLDRQDYSGVLFYEIK